MSPQSNQLVQLWQQAMKLKYAGEWESAVQLFNQILQVQPDWEHGYGDFNLAQCYEELGRFSDARSHYQRAVHVAPTDRIILGAFASFLFLHGKPTEAFDSHIQLLTLERQDGDSDGMYATMTALKSLGYRLGWSQEETESRIARSVKVGGNP
jgi:tetratricopeptide (TPR) repeat protein